MVAIIHFTIREVSKSSQATLGLRLRRYKLVSLVSAKIFNTIHRGDRIRCAEAAALFRLDFIHFDFEM
jgi:hypothetical protein